MVKIIEDPLIIKVCPIRSDFIMAMFKNYSAGASGFDLKSFTYPYFELKGNQRATIPCGFSLEIPRGFQAQIVSRSGLAADFGVIVLNSPGIIDSDYRGEIKVVLHNISENMYKINYLDRIAQIIFSKVESPQFELAASLSKSDRGIGGFGSTGNNDDY